VHSPFTRLQLATRIHLALLRLVGEGVDLTRMLRERTYAHEVLGVCRSLDDRDLLALADRFDEITAAESAQRHMQVAAREARAALALLPRRTADVPQEMPWSRHTSGFGLTQALAMLDSDPTDAPSRFSPLRWLAGRVERTQRP
jgi:hypothetical protein